VKACQEKLTTLQVSLITRDLPLLDYDYFHDETIKKLAISAHDNLQNAIVDREKAMQHVIKAHSEINEKFISPNATQLGFFQPSSIESNSLSISENTSTTKQSLAG
jgi:hypothetical protein